MDTVLEDHNLQQKRNPEVEMKVLTIVGIDRATQSALP